MRLVSASIIHEDSSPYVITAAYELRGPVDTGRLQAAVRDLPRLRPGLAVSYQLAGGTLRMTPVAGAAGHLDVQEAGDLAGPAVPVQDLVEELIAGWSWDLSQPPHLRAALCELRAGRFLLVMGVHHIAADAAGFDQLLKDLGRLYNGQLGDPVPDAAELLAAGAAAVPAGKLSQSLAYWRRELGGAGLSVLDLPLPARESAGPQPGRLLHDEVEFSLPSDPSLPARSAATPGSAVTALFGAYLALLAGQDEACLVYPIPGLARRPARGSSAPLLSTPGLGVLRLHLAGRTTADRVIRQCQRKVMLGMRHPYGALEAWNEHRLAGAATLPNVIVQWVQRIGYRAAPDGLDQVEVVKLRTPLWVSEFDLDLWVGGRWGTLSCRLGFRPDRAPAPAVAALAAGFQDFFAQAMRRPDAELSELPLSSTPAPAAAAAGEAAAIAARPGPAGPDIVSAICAAGPDLPAIATADGVTRYGELATMAARWAGVLADHGVRHGQRVAVDLQPGTAAECPYGIWAAGAVYVPLTADLPPDRVRYLLGAAGAAAVITDRPGWYAAHLPALTVIKAGAAGRREPVAEPARPAADWPAYVVFTSGSTGLPKAVEATHGNLLSAVRGFQRAVGVPAGARIAQTSAATFDPSLLEMLLAVEVQGCQVIAPGPARRDPRQLARWIDAERVDFFEATPTVWEELAPHLEALGHRPAVCASGGEVLPAGLAARILRLGTELWNLYGPSETTIWATAHRCAAGRQPSIGRPLPGIHVRVVNRHLRTLPAGFVGEIVIGGRGVTRGYPADPELTAERFVAAPGNGAGARCYRTGDRGWSAADGELHYAGRTDRQVKIAGKRIDPAETEFALAGQPGIRHAVAAMALVPGHPGDSLCGYATTDGPLDREEILRGLREQLPRHAVPVALVELAELPRTTTGKVDAAALPRPAEADLLQLPTRFVRPGTATEAVVAAAFEQVLGAAPVGRHDDFFDLGGTSLSGLRLARVLESLLGREVEVSVIYDGVTVRDIALLLAG
jgi:amino acid adenylation domain-containing protein